jgi:hypothetical protein
LTETAIQNFRKLNVAPRQKNTAACPPRAARDLAPWPAAERMKGISAVAPTSPVHFLLLLPSRLQKGKNRAAIPLSSPTSSTVSHATPPAA